MSLPQSDHWERIHHIAVHVADIEAAEQRYRDVLDMSIAFREGRDGNEYRQLSGDEPWAGVASTVEEITMSFLRRGGIVIGLEADDGSAGERGAIDHLSVRVTPETLDRIRSRASNHSCTIEGDDPTYIQMPDGVTWEFYPRE